MRGRLGPTLAGLTAFLLSCPFLFQSGAHDGDIPVFKTYGDLIRGGAVPYRDFHPEYPPGAMAIFAIPSFISEHHYLAVFRLLTAIGMVVLLVLLGNLVSRLELTTARAYGALVFAALTPALMGAFMLRRFDVWPAAITVAALLMLVERRPYPALALLALGSVVKVYPLILLPVALLAIERGARLRAFALFCAIGVVVMGPFALIGHAGLYDSVAGQANRALHVDSLGSSALLVLHRPVHLMFDGGGWSIFGSGAGAIAKLQSLLQVAGIALSAWLFARSRRSTDDLFAAAATTLAAGAILGKILTPQYLLWVAPVIVLGGELRAVALFTGALVATNLLFPDRYAGLLALHDGEIWLLGVRNLLLVGVVVLLYLRQLRLTRAVPGTS